MSLDIYGKEDVRNILRATYVASEGSAALLGEVLSDPELQQVALGKLLRIYRQGFANAIGAVGLAFGLTELLVSPVHDFEGSCATVNTPVVVQQLSGTAKTPAEPELRDMDLGRFMWTKAQLDQRR